MRLSKQHISSLVSSDVLRVPHTAELELPEKILQFGTGVLLRGLPDQLISNANHNGHFNGRIIVVKSTTHGETDAFAEQDGLYTVAVRGISEGENISYNHIVSSVSRVLNAATQWDEILQCAADPQMQVILSNTTEVGISMTKDNVHASPPQSFPGKLLAFLYHRFKLFNGDKEKGMVIIPTELVPDNGDLLLAIVLEQAHVHGLEIAFIDWIENANYFCNSLVDRIVPGKLNKEQQLKNENLLGYKDELMIMCEPYALWAIQVKEGKAKKVLSFANDNPSIVLAPEIEKFRELKLRLLNGSHSFSCGLATLAGFDTVKEAMAEESFNDFIKSLMFDEIVPAILSTSISEREAINFANQVLDRYRNPFIEHHWSAICTQYSSKMMMRNVPLIEAYYEKTGNTPLLMSLGMAAHILYMRSELQPNGIFEGFVSGKTYAINDDHAGWYHNAWDQYGEKGIVTAVLSNKTLWNTDLSLLKGFVDSVKNSLQSLMHNNSKEILQSIKTKTAVTK